MLFFFFDKMVFFWLYKENNMNTAFSVDAFKPFLRMQAFDKELIHILIKAVELNACLIIKITNR